MHQPQQVQAIACYFIYQAPTLRLAISFSLAMPELSCI
jgi:hypothetical protein